MIISFEPESCTATINCDQLAAFARSRSGLSASRLGFSDKTSSSDESDVYFSNRKLKLEIPTEDCTYVIEGTADAVYKANDGLYVVECVSFVKRSLFGISPLTDSRFLAKATLLAYLLTKELMLDSVRIKTVFTKKSSGESKAFEAVISVETLHRMFTSLLSRALPFIRARIARLGEGTVQIQELTFPYESMRQGQRDFILEAFRAIRTGKRLIVNAPTGIGKTISALYPAVKALGEGFTDKIFYLTAKNVAGNAALDAAAVLASKAPLLKCIMITAKDRQCFLAGKDHPYSPLNCIHGCKYVDEIDGISYEERRDSALLELFDTGSVYTPKMVEEIAKKFFVCPYELSLDASEYCDIVVCDYNYIFDKRIRFKRYFEGVTDSKYTFLIDEAHNLPDRARELYSATLDSKNFTLLSEDIDTAFANDAPLKEALCAVNETFAQLRSLCETRQITDHETGADMNVGFYISDSVPDFVIEPLSRFRVLCDDRMKHTPEPAAKYLEHPRTAVRKFLDSAELFDKQFTFYLELVGDRLSVRILCLDPSKLLDKSMSMGKATVLFSATLTPIDYFSDILGARSAVQMTLDSPYSPENLCIAAVDTVSTRLNDRGNTAWDTAEIIATAVDAKSGHYIAYFPSYEYMKSVCRVFREMMPHAKTVVQKASMNIAERNRFLMEFSENSQEETVVGFCVLGGIFSEGIDLRGERLIGSIIVGTGLPGLSSETNIISEYYERTRENGHDYAYTYPGFNKVLQAAGRVIRSETDRGVVILIDDRYGERGMRELFPAHWRHLKYVGDTVSLAALLDKFWQDNI